MIRSCIVIYRAWAKVSEADMVANDLSGSKLMWLNEEQDKDRDEFPIKVLTVFSKWISIKSFNIVFDGPIMKAKAQFDDHDGLEHYGALTHLCPKSHNNVSSVDYVAKKMKCGVAVGEFGDDHGYGAISIGFQNRKATVMLTSPLSDEELLERTEKDLVDFIKHCMSKKPRKKRRK